MCTPGEVTGTDSGSAEEQWHSGREHFGTGWKIGGWTDDAVRGVREHNTRMHLRTTALIFIAFLPAWNPLAAQERSAPTETLWEYIPIAAQVKPDKEWKQYPSLTLEGMRDFQVGAADGNLNVFGGDPRHRTEATGFFHVQKEGGRWWLIDPEGCYNIQRGVVSVGVPKTEKGETAAHDAFGGYAEWAEATANLLRANGFSCTGAWSDDQRLQTAEGRLPYTRILNMMNLYGKKKGGTFQQPGHTGYPNDCVFVFDEEFPRFCDSLAGQLEVVAKDSFLIGYFSDNELPFPSDALIRCLQLPDTDAGNRAATRWLTERKYPMDGGAPADAVQAEFLEYMANEYFRITTEAIRRHDPNHMILGPRFYGASLKCRAVFVPAGRHIDAISVNYYNRWTPDAAEMEAWVTWSGKPFLVTEWYVKGEDSGLPNRSGAGWIVPTQRDRGVFYQNFALHLLQNKGCVGWHWFKYIDNDPGDPGVDPSNNDSNKGIVDIRYEPYTGMLSLMRGINTRVYRLIDYFDNGTTQ